MWVDYRGILPKVLRELGNYQRILVAGGEAHRQETTQLNGQEGLEKITEVRVPIDENGFSLNLTTLCAGLQAKTLALSLSHPEISTQYLIIPNTAADAERVQELYDDAVNQIVSAVKSLRNQILSKR